MDIFERINEYIGNVAVLFLFFSGVTISIMLLGTRLRKYKTQKEVLLKSECGDRSSELKNKNGHSPFGSLCLALAGTLGVGNISGVAAAISVGGAGAVFWMWVSAIFCSALKYAEVVLAVKFRTKISNGGYSGGAHLYIKNGLGAGRVATLFCFLCVFASYTVGNMTQLNAAAQSLNFSFGLNTWICGICGFALLLLFCRSGSAIYSFTLRSIPALCVGYISLCLAVIFQNYTEIGAVMRHIINSAFTPQAGMGGALGVLCGRAVRVGITRGVMSNEAGCGTAPIAHASAEVRSPFSQGLLGVFEVLFDTLFLCTLTAFVILLSDTPIDGALSTVYAISSFATVLGQWVKIPLSIAMLLFAIASAVGWNYYGRVSLSYIGVGDRGIFFYCLSYGVCGFLGSVMAEGIIWKLSDLSIYLMSFINTASVLLLSRFLKRKNGIDNLNCR